MAITEPPERRQLIGVILLVALAYLPLARFLDWRITLFASGCLLLRLAAMRWPALSPGRVPLVGLTLLGALNVLTVYHSMAGKLGGAALFATMLALKLLELNQRRDLRVVAVILGFLVVVQFLFDESLGLAAYLGVVTLGAVLLLVDLNGGLGVRPSARSLGIGLRLAAQALPLTVVLFLLFPRLSAPLWNLGISGETATTGMSDVMEPGAISELVINGELAFRVRFDGRPPQADDLYWRGPILWKAEERRWSLGQDPAMRPSGVDPLPLAEDLIAYEVLLEPSKQHWLFALDLPVSYPPEVKRTAAHQLLSPTPVTSVRRYRVESALTYETGEAADWEHQAALALPRNVTERMRALVAGWRDSTDSDWELVQAGLRFLNREAFYYTLLPPRLGANPTDEFLFETRQGFCEHFAGSFAILMRIAGIPSRVVLGYLGGEVNRLGGYHMVWQSNAHAWVELYISGRGWVRVDPTASVDPLRVDNRSAAGVLGGASSARFDIDRNGWLVSLARQGMFLFDSVEAAWQDWILDFSIEDQLGLLDRLGLSAWGESGLALLMVGLVSGVIGVLLGRMLGRDQVGSPLEQLYERFCRRLARIGLQRGQDEGPQDFGRRILRARPDLAGPVGRFLSLYIAQRYAPQPLPDGVRRLRDLLQGFRPRRLS